MYILHISYQLSAISISHLTWSFAAKGRYAIKPLLKWCFLFAGTARKQKTPFYPAALAAKLHAKE
jgi:hypothetical protein